MQITVVAVGRARMGPEALLFEQYKSRMQSPFSLQLKEVEEKRPIVRAERRKNEAILLKACIADGAHLVALDEQGKSFSSRNFATMIESLQNQGVRDLVFIIGGAEGLDNTLKSQAHQTISFGMQTWPHLLVRGMLAEQLYRAQCIIGGHPYHRE